jgi:hypothetical protein
MLVKIKLLDGSDAVIQSELVTRFRDSHPQTVPPSVVIDFPPRRYTSSESLETLFARFDPHLDLARLTTPAGTPVIVNADLVSSVTPATVHHPNARAVVTFLEGGDQQVRETVAEAAAALGAAD